MREIRNIIFSALVVGLVLLYGLNMLDEAISKVPQEPNVPAFFTSDEWQGVEIKEL